MSALSLVSCGGAAGDPGTLAVDTTPTPPAAWQTATYNATLSGTGDVARMEYMVDCATPAQNLASGGQVPITDGVHTLSHRAVDSGGLATSWIDETVSVDTVAPVDTTTDATGWHTGTTTVTASGTDATSGVASIDYTLDGTPGTLAPGATLPVSGDGSHTLVTEAVDVAGNHSSQRTDTIQIDSQAPTDTTTYPAG
jgi:cytochrome c